MAALEKLVRAVGKFSYADYIDQVIQHETTVPIFCDEKGNRFDIKAYREEFYEALEARGIDDPITEAM